MGWITSRSHFYMNPRRALGLIVLVPMIAAGCSHRLAADSQGGEDAFRLPEIGDVRGDGPPHPRDRHRLDLSDAEPRLHPLSETGNSPYEIAGRHFTPLIEATGYRATGVASWYGRKFHGQPTSSGEIYDMYQMTAAHRILPLPSYVKVTNVDSGAVAIVKVNDRGPFRDDRLIDLSWAAAVKLGADISGTINVHIEALQAERSGNTAILKAPPDRPKSRGGYQLFLQAGAFTDELNAQELRRRLIQAGVDAVEISSHARDGGIMFRVRIGPLPDQLAVEKQQKLLATRFQTKGRLVYERHN